MDDRLFERAEEAIRRSRELHRHRKIIFQHMQDIAAHRLIVANSWGLLVKKADARAAKASKEALRIARA